MIRKIYIIHYIVIISIIFIFILYWAYIFIMNLMLEETYGYIIGEKSTSGEYYSNVGTIGLSQGLTHYTNKYSYSEMFYKYEVNKKLYEKNKISNILIFPKIKHDKNKIIVYYNKYINGYSILFKCNLKYFLINSIPLVIMIIIAIHYRSKHFKSIKMIEILKYYFRIDKTLLKKYDIK